jgi:hypothetical protein
VKVGPDRKPRRGYPKDHRSIAQYGQVEAVAVEVTRRGLSSATLSQKALISSFSVLSPTWGAPTASTAVRDKRSDADNRVVDVLRELIPDRLADFHVGLADEVVGCCEPGKVGHSLQVPRR